VTVHEVIHKGRPHIGEGVMSWTNADAVLHKKLSYREGPRDASCQLKSCQLPRNSAETTYTTSPGQIDGMKLEI